MINLFYYYYGISLEPKKHRRKLKKNVKHAICGAGAFICLCTFFGMSHLTTTAHAEDVGDVEQVIVKLSDSQSDPLEEIPANPQSVYAVKQMSVLCDPSYTSASIEEASKRTRFFLLESGEEFSKVLTESGKTGWVLTSSVSNTLDTIFDAANVEKYAVDGAVIYSEPNAASQHITENLEENTAIQVVGTSPQTFQKVVYNGTTGYMENSALMDSKKEYPKEPVYTWSGAKLSKSAGTVVGPSGKETYYNLDMSGVVRIMRRLGFSEAEYPYWVRSDGCKMLGDYIMVAADLSAHPRGSTMEISLGTAIVCDTGGFVTNGSGTKVDVAVTW